MEYEVRAYNQALEAAKNFGLDGILFNMYSSIWDMITRDVYVPDDNIFGKFNDLLNKNSINTIYVTDNSSNLSDILYKMSLYGWTLQEVNLNKFYPKMYGSCQYMFTLTK